MQVIVNVNARASGLILLGEVFRIPVNPNADDAPVGPPVHASNGNDYGLDLPPESYLLKFHMTAGFGQYRVSILDGKGATLASGDYDTTKTGYGGKSLAFEVRA